MLLVTLFRGNDHKRLESDEEKLLSDLCLGELLKRKADEGVRVLLLIWDEYRGVMGTHDTRTEEFFRGSRVFVGSGSRWRMNREWTDWKRHVLVRYIFTHHQKAVVMDGTPSAKEEKGKTIVAYLGGLDLTGEGRDRWGKALHTVLLQWNPSLSHQMVAMTLPSTRCSSPR